MLHGHGLVDHGERGAEQGEEVLGCVVHEHADVQRRAGHRHACGRAEKYKDCVEWKLQLSLRLVKGGDADNMSTKPGVTFVAA